MKRTISILLFAVLVSSCVKHENLYDANKEKEEAEKNFPVPDINPDQNWKTETSRTLNVTMNENTGVTYTVKVFDGYPFNTEEKVSLLAKAEVNDGSVATLKFDAPTVLERVYVMRQAGKDYVFRAADLKDEQFSVTFGETIARSIGARSMGGRVDSYNYTDCNKNKATRITQGSELKNLKEGSYYIDSEVTAAAKVSLGANVFLYILEGGILKAEGTMTLNQGNSFVSVLEGGKLTVKGDMSLDGNNGGDLFPALYNDGTVETDDVTLIKAVLRNNNFFSASGKKGFELKNGAEVYNNCRMIIDGDSDCVFEVNEETTFNNAGYVEVEKGAAWYEDCFISMTDGAVFEIDNKLVIEGINLSMNGSKALIKADEVSAHKNKDEKVTFNYEGIINFSCDTPENLSEYINLIGAEIKDDGNCKVDYELDDVPDVSPSVTTFAFEDIISGDTDYDFNDVVLHISNVVDEKIKIILVAAGAVNAITVDYSLDNGQNYSPLSFNGQREVHTAFGRLVTEMINTSNPITDTKGKNLPSCEILNVQNDFSFVNSGRIRINVKGENRDYQIDSYTEPGKTPFALSVPRAWAYPKEHVRIDVAYSKFADWVRGQSAKDWYNY